METYSFWADLLHTFRMMSDAVKVLLIYMPGAFILGFAALYLHHLRRHAPPARQQPYTILPPEKPLRYEPIHPSIETLRRLDDYMEEMKVPRDVKRHTPPSC
ncbi:hypothetical protein RMR10_010530 [Agrobacterium rosae]|uniref:hypothetical protein n=1 Tax=Agrobacterium rosae TaxID=1972867 RepID=UPI002A142962|nr:hypothetical protein [Agrobacterium rosae]MDX8313059.1 hypothetical protein [Agrobacterium rosae]